LAPHVPELVAGKFEYAVSSQHLASEDTMELFFQFFENSSTQIAW